VAALPEKAKVPPTWLGAFDAFAPNFWTLPTPCDQGIQDTPYHVFNTAGLPIGIVAIRKHLSLRQWLKTRILAHCGEQKRSVSFPNRLRIYTLLMRTSGALPNFLPPSSPELSKLLSTFNSQILLPEHLTKEQQKLVYSQESRAKLEAEPIEITLGEVTLPLEHLDRNRLPNRYKRLREICNQSETKEDWENVVRCLEGFQEAGIKVHWQWQELVIRKLNLAGMQHLVLKALQRAKETGVKLSNYGVLRAVLRTVHDKAALADWAQDDTIKAHKLAKQVVELMEDEEHYVGKRPVKPRGKPDKFAEGDYRGRPSVVALPTEMAAVLADRYGGDKEEVKKLSSRLVHALQQSGYTVHLPPLSSCICGPILTKRSRHH